MGLSEVFGKLFMNHSMTKLEQQIEEAILSTLVVENKESIKAYCVPKIMAILRSDLTRRQLDQCLEMMKQAPGRSYPIR